jgi:hypothetical protein
MKYLYYRQNGDISMICPVEDYDTKDSYIKIDDSEAEGFFSGAKLQFEYKVVPDPDIKNQGWIERKFQSVAEDTWVPVGDRVYAVPANLEGAAVIIQQGCKSKKIIVKLTPRANAWWNENQYFNLPSVFLVACRPHDPHLFLWAHNIPADALGAGYEFDYSGEDQITFYTRKIFSSYSHELLS